MIEGSSVEGMHEVCSYTLTKVGGGGAGGGETNERRSETSDEWVDDISETEELTWTIVGQVAEPL